MSRPHDEFRKRVEGLRLQVDLAARLNVDAMVRAQSVMTLIDNALAKLDADLRDEAEGDEAEYAGRVEF